MTLSDTKHPGTALLEAVQRGLPLLADLCRCDVLIYRRSDQPNTAVVVASARPSPVATVFGEKMIGRQVGKKSDPAIFEVLQRGRVRRVVHDSGSTPTVQELFPLRDEDGTIAGVLNCEASSLEYERMQKKSPVFQKALVGIRKAIMAGRLHGADTLDRLGEHDGLMVIDAKGVVQYISGIAENLYRRLGHTGSLLSSHIDELKTDEAIVAQAFETNVCQQIEVFERDLIWIKKAIPIEAEEGPWFPGRSVRREGPGSVLLIVRDVTEERSRDTELRVKSTMIKEIHHRVKNNLQTIASLLRLQARRSSNPEVVELLSDSVARIMSVAVVHEFLSYDEEAVINIREVCGRIVTEVTHGILDPSQRIRIAIEGESVVLPARQATSTALVVNELLQNSIKHGFDGRTEGRITIRLTQGEDDLTIEIEDDGNGMSEGQIAEANNHLGLQIVQTLVRDDLRGQFEMISRGGVTTRVRLPRVTRRTSQKEDR